MISNLGWAIRRLMAPQWRLMAGCAVLMVLGSLFSAVQPLISRQVVDGVVGTGLTSPVWGWVGLMGLTFLLPGVLHNVGSLPTTALDERTIRQLDQLVIDAGAAMPDIAALEQPTMHDRIQHVRSTILLIMRLPQACLDTVALGLATLTLLVSLATLVWWVPLLLLAAAVPHMIGEKRMIEVRHLTLRDQSRVTREMDYCMTAASEPQLAKEVRAFGLGDFFLRRFDSRSNRSLAELARMRVRSSRWSVLAALGYALAVAISFGWVARQAAAGLMSAGDIALFLTAITSLFVTLFRLAIAVTMSVLEPLKNLDALRELESQAQPRIRVVEPGVAMPTRLTSGVTLSDVRFGYGTDDASGQEVLRGVDLELPAGQTTALVGENGEGKSTLVKLLTRMYDPDSGSITVDGVALDAYDLRSWRSRIATVYQDHARFSFTLGDNIAIGQPELLAPDVSDDERRALVLAAADRGGALGVVDKLPDGLDTELTRRFGGVDLSGGEWQRVATARAFLPDAALIVLDEPTSALDVDAERRLFDRFGELVRGRTAVMISHRFSTVRTADRIAVLADGVIAECGSHAELMDLDGRYAELFRLQADRYQ